MFEKSLTKKMQDIVLEGKIPAKTVCTRIKKPYSTLLRELNPFDTHAKLGAETMFEIVKVTRNVAVLEFMAEELGYTLQPRTPRPVRQAPRAPQRMEAGL
ncbi:phage regulatory CII family protein [Pseudodesulfovibrio senegalensis]|uniref:Uncharacterized protein n=1 Tax=Pseudodesulfovibrio senegalensis TaxID=1721087 RepID=A0A6N6N5R0_9BACT|nr:phage regulatory CII family protein [Pseudodesulfovibrio senegalensis]KAB1442226.1 hypothetical protein F8A88_07150 [Pseudodesulfovibrio senegalensis]